ncbi:MAG: mechanosensitive ion channel family protein [Pirellulales bacterium]
MQPITFVEQLVALSGIRDGNTTRSLIAAVVAAALFLLTAPQGRRWLARGPMLLLGLAILPLVAAALFPEEAAAGEAATLGSRFFVLAALFQSMVLIALVSVWERLARPPSAILLDVLRWVAAAAAAAIILGEAGVEPSTLFAGSAVVTAAVGFALRDTLGNVFSGLALQAERPFELGDWIQYDANPAHIGRVVELNWRATRVITLDEAFVVIPNGQLGLASIRNFSKPDPWSRRSLFVTTPYTVSPQLVQEVILEAIRGSFGLLDHPSPSVVTNAFTDRGVEHWVRFFTTEFDKRDRVDGMARDRIWFALARHGIEIPVATQQVRLSRLPAPIPEPPEAATDRRHAMLRQVGLFTVLDEPARLRLAASAREQAFAAGEPIIRQGDPGTSMFVIENGRVAVSVADDSGATSHLAELGPGDFFGEMSLLTGEPRSATVTALVETRLLTIDKDTFRPCLEVEPRLAEALEQFLVGRRAAQTTAISRDPTPPQEHDLLRRILEFFAI